MILTYNNTKDLQGQDWLMLELSAEKYVQTLIRRLVNSVPNIFRQQSLEIFVPVMKRGLDVFEMSSGNYLFVRSSHPKTINRLCQLKGVVGVVSQGENRYIMPIKVTDAYVQDIIQKCEAAFHARADNILPGGFVRILDGQARDFCGTVTQVDDGRATVVVELKSKQLMVETPTRNLEDLSQVPANQRVFYYSPLIPEMIQLHGNEAAALIAEDLHHTEQTAPPLEPPPPILPFVYRRVRLNTVTQLVQRLVSEGVILPKELAVHVMTAIREGRVKKPKSSYVIQQIIRNAVFAHFRTHDNPPPRDFFEVRKRYGKPFHIHAQEISDIDPSLGIFPYNPNPLKDGRCREARASRG